VGVLSDRLAGMLVAEPELTQHLIVELDPVERLRLVTDALEEIAGRVAGGPGRVLN
jgi:hypothetical protein